MTTCDNTMKCICNGVSGCYTCGMCHITQSYDDDFPALSRKDNKTHLCSKCGQIEAMVEYNESISAKFSNYDVNGNIEGSWFTQ